MIWSRSTTEPPRQGLSWEQLWEAEDDGLIFTWERGREMSAQAPALAADARKGVLVTLPWKGGCAAGLKMTAKFGTLHYLAMWQGLRGDDLEIDTSCPVVKTCSATGIVVTFTADSSKWINA